MSNLIAWPFIISTARQLSGDKQLLRGKLIVI